MIGSLRCDKKSKLAIVSTFQHRIDSIILSYGLFVLSISRIAIVIVILIAITNYHESSRSKLKKNRYLLDISHSNHRVKTSD
jgi:hypothetical protein